MLLLALLACPRPPDEVPPPTPEPVVPTADTAPPVVHVLEGPAVHALPLAPPPACPGVGPTWFVDVTPCAGLSSALHVLGSQGGTEWYTTGQAWADFDGDTWLDVIVTSWDGQNTRLFLGSPNGTFTPRNDPGLANTPASGVVVGDIDGDGDPDAWLAGRARDFLLEHDGAVLQSQPNAPSHSGLGQSGSLADLDGDGVLELFVANYLCPECATGPAPCDASTDGLFVRTPSGWRDRTELVFGTGNLTCGYAFVGVFSDLDDDGDLDLYVANDRGNDGPDVPGNYMYRNTFWRNEGPGCGAACFTEIARENGTALGMDAMGIDIGDVDLDGDPDIVITDTGPTRLLINQGDGQFVDEAAARGLHVGSPSVGWGVALFDMDNDGDLDLFAAGTGAESLHRNDDGLFVPVSEFGVPPDGRLTHGLAAADYDRDGRVDLILGDRAWGYRLLRNTLDTDHTWIGTRLVGFGAGGPNAIGAKVTITDDSGRVQSREVRAGISSGGGNDLGLHFGLGTAQITAAEVRWPDGTIESFQPTPNRWNVVTRQPPP